MIDATFTKYVRPGALLSTLLLFMILMIIDGNIGEFSIKEHYLTILETLLTTMVVFYYSSRGIEKVAKTIKIDMSTKIDSNEISDSNEKPKPLDKE